MHPICLVWETTVKSRKTKIVATKEFAKAEATAERLPGSCSTCKAIQGLPKPAEKTGDLAVLKMKTPSMVLFFANQKGWWMLWECWTTLLGRPMRFRLHCFTLSLLGFVQKKSDTNLGVQCLRDPGVVAPISELNFSKCFTTCLVESFKLCKVFCLSSDMKRRERQETQSWYSSAYDIKSDYYMMIDILYCMFVAHKMYRYIHICVYSVHGYNIDHTNIYTTCIHTAYTDII